MQGPVSTEPRSAQRLADDLGRDREAARRRRWSSRRRPCRRPRPRASTSGPAGVAAAHRAAQRGDRAVDRPAAVGVLADRVAGLAEPRRRDRVGPVLRVAEHGARRRPRSRSAAIGRVGRFGADPQQREVVVGVVVDRRRVELDARPGWSTVVSSSPATTWALVTTRPGPTAQPEPSTPSPQAVPSTRTTEPPAPQHVGVGGDRRRRAAATGAAGPVIDGAGSTRSSALRTGPERRQHVVEAAQDHRALHVGAQARRPRRVQGDRAEDPGQAERHRGDQRRAAGAVGAGAATPAADQLRAAAPARSPPARPRPGRPTSSAPSAAQSGA